MNRLPHLAQAQIPSRGGQAHNDARKGFSLIELIVVITIIAVVTAVGFVSFGGVNKKARDGRRMADLEKYRVALEMARQVGNTYPANLGVLVTMNLLSGTAVDPKSNSAYPYILVSSYKYNIGASMEDLGSTNIAPFGGCGGSCNYQVKNP